MHKIWLSFFLFFIFLIFLMIFSNWNISPTIDEPIHIISGMENVEGYWKTNFEHPPLLKFFSGYLLKFFGIKLKKDLMAKYQKEPNLENLYELLKGTFENPKDTMKILRISRLSPFFFYILLILFSYLWAKDIFSHKRALILIMLVGLNPIVLANGALVHTDVPLASLLVVSGYFFWLFYEKNSKKNLFLSSIFFGFALATKYSALLFFPIFVFLLFLKKRIKLYRKLINCFLFSTFAILVIFFVLLLSSYKNKKEEMERAIFVSALELPCENNLKEDFKERALNLNKITLISPYLIGIYRVYFHNKYCAPLNYFKGRFYEKGYIFYFPLAFLIKNNLGFILIFIFSLFLALKYGTQRDFFFLYISLYYFLLSLSSNYNIGVRHLIPAIIFLSFFISNHIFIDYLKKRAYILIPYILIFIFFLETVISYPNYMEHFNLLISKNRGSYLINDSNYDWGQKIYKLYLYSKEKNIKINCFLYGFSEPFLKEGNLEELKPNFFLEKGYYAISDYYENIFLSFERYGIDTNSILLKENLKVTYLLYRTPLKEILSRGKLVKDFNSIRVYLLE